MIVDVRVLSAYLLIILAVAALFLGQLSGHMGTALGIILPGVLGLIGVLIAVERGAVSAAAARSALLLALLGTMLLLSIIGYRYAEDFPYQVHMVLIFLGSAFVLFRVIPVILEGMKAAPVIPGQDIDPGKPLQYNTAIVRAGVIVTMFWGIVGMLVGVIVATQLVFPELSFNTPWLTFGRLRPVHTSGVIFAFGGNALLATSFYVVQRTCRARLLGDWTPWLVFWGFQSFLVLAVAGYLTGGTQGKEYAEPVWYLDIYLAVIWLTYLTVFLGTILKRREPHIYVANWYYLAFIVVVAMLHVVNSGALPVSLFSSESYSFYAGVEDAMIQWWYGHNAVGFFLTAGFLGIMYYFIPKASGRPIFSYRLSVVGFWTLVFTYIWAGPHHLHYTALPEWTQFLGMTFSLILWMPSWASVINGVMTLNGAWDKLRTDPTIRMLVTAVAFYGMSTFEGPLMSIREVNALSHYTDWTVGHVHSGALGWVGMVVFGAFYYLTPRLWGRARIYSTKLIEWHYWIAMLGIVFYITAMWISGIMQGLMWRAYNSMGFLDYAFIETVEAMEPYYAIRVLGGLLFLIGTCIMAYNLYRTVVDPATQRSATAQPMAAE